LANVPFIEQAELRIIYKGSPIDHVHRATSFALAKSSSRSRPWLS
jgi:hypothetical protein